MSHQRMTSNSSGTIVRAILLISVFIVIFVITLGIAAFLLFGPGFSAENVALAGSPGPVANPTPTVEPRPLVTPVAGTMITLQNVALGFAVDYPADWAKSEKSLRVIFSPTEAGLETESWQQPGIWLGIPASDTTEPATLLQEILSDLPASPQVLKTNTITLAGQPWSSVQIQFEPDSLDQPVLATVAATKRNEVGYYLVAAAPADRWSAVNPIFQGMLNSLHFTAEAVIRPTDATRPPTPTPTPTPRIYVVQSGDTLSEIAVQFGVSMDMLVARNGIDDPARLRVGQKIIIPNRR